MQVKKLRKSSSFEDNKIATYSTDDLAMEMNESETTVDDDDNDDDDDEHLSEDSGTEDNEQAEYSGSDSDDDDSDMQTEDVGDEEEDHSDDEESEYSDNEAVGNAGWADAISKVLKTNKPKSKKTLVLSRARKINDPKYDVEVKEDPGFEVEGESKEEKVKTEPVEHKISAAKEKELKLKRKAWKNLCRVKPDVLQKDRERALTKIATKGVVQLFNAVRQQQKTIETGFNAAGGSERRKEKVLKAVDKNSFLDILMGPTKSAVISHRSKPAEDVKPTVKLEDDDKKTPLWSVLRDDFLVGGKLKDWDRAPDGDAEDNGEERSSANEASDSSGGSDSE